MRKWTSIAWLVSAIIILYTGLFHYPKWEKEGTESTISWDVSGYYLYLPAIFIYKDLKEVKFLPEILEKYGPTPEDQQVHTTASGRKVLKYACGQSIAYAPFFFIAHGVAAASDHEADGFSEPYQLTLGLGMLFYALLGIWLLGRVLLRYFSDRVAALTLLTVAVATNYLNYAAIDGALTHNVLFTCYAGLLLLTVRFYERPSAILAVCIGALVGLMTLIRPTELIAILIPLFWQQGLVSNVRRLVPAFISLTIVGSLQLIYWKFSSGNWITYSYGEFGFDWFTPHFWDGMVSYRSGWLVYSPVMIFSLIGFFFLYRTNKVIFRPLVIFSLIFMYLCFAWEVWWYEGLGIRAMVQAYPVLAIPMAATFTRIGRGANWGKWITGVLLILFTSYNFWLTHHSHRGEPILVLGHMTGDYFWRVVFTWELDRNNYKYLDRSGHFPGEPSLTPLWSLSPDNPLKLPDEDLYSPLYRVPINMEAGWLRATAELSLGDQEYNHWAMTQLILQVGNQEKKVKGRFIRVNRLLDPGEPAPVYLELELPKEPVDTAYIQVWAPGGKEVFIHHLELAQIR